MSVTTQISTFLLNLVFTYKYALLFPVTAIEGPLVTIASGFMVSLKIMNPAIALPIIIAGDVASDIFYYFVGRYGERWRLTRSVIRYFKFEKHKKKAEASFRKHGGKILLFGKLTHALGIVSLIGAGYFGMDFLPFLGYSILGTAIKSSLLMYLGYLAGSAYLRYAHSFETVSIIVTIVALLITFGTLFVLRSRGDDESDEIPFQTL